MIVDAQSVKNSDSAGPKGYDAGKKIVGIKRHLVVDTQGLPHATAVTPANVTDRQGALQALDRCTDRLLSVRCVQTDAGYRGTPFAEAVHNRLGARVEVVRRTEAHRFAVMPQRWVVERSFAWLTKCRRLWRNCERNLTTSLQFIHLAFLALLLKRL